jgi:hypothetical protein
MALLCAALVVIVATGNAHQTARIDSFGEHCRAADGHIYKPDSISFCVSSDGRWLEVYP